MVREEGRVLLLLPVRATPGLARVYRPPQDQGLGGLELRRGEEDVVPYGRWAEGQAGRPSR